MGQRTAGRLLLSTIVLSLAVFIPHADGRVFAAEALEVTATADAWLNKAKPTTNYGSAAALRAQRGASQSVLRFNISAWYGLPLDKFHLNLAGVVGDGSTLAVHSTTGAWKEATVTWQSRPSAVAAAGPAVVNGSAVRFNIKPLFPNGVVDRDKLDLRVTDTSGLQVRFGSRESSTKPRLTLIPATGATAFGMPPVADTFANKAKPATNFKSAQWLKVDGSPRKESYVKFDTSAWNGRSVDKVVLRLTLKDAGGGGISVLRTGTGWKEGGLTWNNRPTGGTVVATISKAVAAGILDIDVTAAFANKVVNSDLFSLRIRTSHADGFAFSSREGPSAPSLQITPGTSVSNPNPSPSASPSASPTASPSASPTASPSASPSPSPSASPTPTPEPLFYFRGGGNAHGVGMSQQGARGRANAGQTYQQILAHYYANTTLGQQDPATLVRVLLAAAYVPTPTMPARVTAVAGSWFSDVFPDSLVTPFPLGSFASLAKDELGVWTAYVYDATGLLLASAPTTDLLMQPTDDATIFYMKFRDSLKTYDRYRGQMRMRVTGTDTLQAVNIVRMDDYLKGVVPAEVPATWPREAVRAQAVAARSYVSFKLRTTNTWDVKPDSSHQVYGGVNIEHSSSNKAVTDTSGVIILNSAGNVAEALFHAVAGGHTENNEYAFVSSSGKPGTPVSYLRGRPDVDQNGVAYEAGVAAYSWVTGSFTMKQLSSMMAKDSRTDVGTITDIKFDRGVSGRAYRVTLTGSKATKTVSGGIFTNVYNANKLSGGNLRSNLHYLQPAP